MESAPTRLSTGASGLDTVLNGGYLKLHRASGTRIELYRQPRGLAQDVLGHKDLSTTEASYQHIDAEERRAKLDQALNGNE